MNSETNFESESQNQKDVVSQETNVPAELIERFDSIEQLRTELRENEDSVLNGEETAKEAQGKRIGLFGSRKAIREIRDGMVVVAGNQVKSAEIQRKLFEYQFQISEAVRSAFSFGIVNLANTRATIRFLREKLSRSAETGTLEELEKEEIERAIRELKSHEDLLERQRRLSERMHESELQIKELQTRCESLQNDVDRLRDERNRDDRQMKNDAAECYGSTRHDHPSKPRFSWLIASGIAVLIALGSLVLSVIALID